MLSELLAEIIASEDCFSCSHKFTDYELQSGMRHATAIDATVYYLCQTCVENSVQCSLLILLIGRVK